MPTAALWKEGAYLPLPVEGRGLKCVWVGSGRCLCIPGANCSGKLPGMRLCASPRNAAKRTDTLLLRPTERGHQQSWDRAAEVSLSPVHAYRAQDLFGNPILCFPQLQKDTFQP